MSVESTGGRVCLCACASRSVGIVTETDLNSAPNSDQSDLHTGRKFVPKKKPHSDDHRTHGGGGDAPVCEHVWCVSCRACIGLTFAPAETFVVKSIKAPRSAQRNSRGTPRHSGADGAAAVAAAVAVASS